ncbi:MAG: hypothetical protein U0R68_13390 [Candidatus Nanopelagicales bacterium]
MTTAKAAARVERYRTRMLEVRALRATEGNTQRVLIADRVLWAIKRDEEACSWLPPLPRGAVSAEWVEGVLGGWWWDTGLDPAYIEAGKLTAEQREAVATYLATVGPLLTDMAARLEEMVAAQPSQA